MANPLGFVDTHIHFFDLENPDLYYSYLEPDFVHPQLGNIDALKKSYHSTDYLIDVDGCRVDKAVHVQAAFGTKDPFKETEWINTIIEDHGFPTAIVANVDLSDTDVRQQLERHTQYETVKGVRDQKAGNYLNDEAYLRGCRELAPFGLHLEVEHWGDLAPVSELAKKLEGTTVVLDHAGRPEQRTQAYLHDWISQIKVVAEAENTVCKISGLGMADPEWTIGSMRPFVEGCIEVFGVERCFFGTNWPVGKTYSSYRRLIEAYETIVHGYSTIEKRALFTTNAERVYRI